jgi:hypothetical protein
MTFDEVLRAWVARKLGKPLLPEDEVSIEWQEGSGCPTCGFSGYVAVRWSTNAPSGKRRLKAQSWTYRDEEMIGLTKELVALSIELERALFIPPDL